MTNEEAQEILLDLSLEDDIDGWVITSKQHTAVCMARKALESQERMQRELKSLDGIAETCDKLEKALELAVHDSDKQGTDIWCHDCPYEDDVKLEHCWECGVKYYKREAGIDS